MSKRFTYYGGIQGGLLPYLTAYWTADNIATDVHINNLGGIFTNPGYNAGINNDAFDFGNTITSSFVRVPDNDLLSFTDGTNDVPFTINLWTYYYTFSSSGNWLVNKRDSISTPDIEYQLLYNTGANVVRFLKISEGSSSNSIRTDSNIAPSLNTWEMWTITSDGSKFGEKIYRNGVDVTASSTENGTYVKMNNTNATLAMGIGGWSTTSINLKHRGKMDEVAIFNATELTQLQIQDLYNGGVGKFYPNI